MCVKFNMRLFSGTFFDYLFSVCLNQPEFPLFRKEREKCQYSHIPFSLTRNRNLLQRAYIEIDLCVLLN